MARMRAVSPIIATMILIMVAIATGVLLYMWTRGMFGGQAPFTADAEYLRLTQYTDTGFYIYDAMFKVTSNINKPGNVTHVTIICVDTNGEQYTIDVDLPNMNATNDATNNVAVIVRTLTTTVYPHKSLHIPITISSKVPLSQCSASFLIKTVDGGTYTANAPAVSAS